MNQTAFQPEAGITEPPATGGDEAAGTVSWTRAARPINEGGFLGFARSWQV